MNKVALVTGASRGIGAAIAKRLAADGFRIVVNYAGNTAKAEEVVSAIVDAGGEAIAVQADVADAEQVKALLKTALDTYGQLDCVVNNAGITRDGLLMRMKEADFDAVLNTNLKGAFLVTQAATRPLLKTSGRIINIASVVGITGNPGQANYVAAKAGLIGFTKSVARELASKGVTANAICPGFIETDMTDELTEAQRNQTLDQIPLKRFGQTDDIASLVSFIASDNARYITGQTLAVDGGMTM
ncbi:MULTISPECIES: 3-oxoacyl-[acyl-carrier-protein] reductase [Exiguobacterium]|uniref:3-oxoacyl-[acyl-carrier-protein] reductase n=1 Tax=Exiguobacterium sibiricum (strain DSM 17290 / CCUG 55495 / CIP 109462 / JCM 13490 / 255-15) TaxID=262543 RepID=B1YIN4_EXIS2|nr:MULTISPECIES: 3-oxoacyl-[acyl-carrier-protein] reductase [Exiguobacterium]ACB61360.1 3-oxoacyl-(acyl-carrier-protein) reductase [Exiguobacterium sibiricum 255-15]MCT4791113.1 3-oxoacyl-[acyl-carrier-protein] reductase [Exiguobacterium artemiae]MDW2884947.1 3-oxoacyl-[acyl-carrier-protein] reductase [Exiguobacterium sibiricum]MDX1258556.1 3-oxoacyl-[acyl-carrier-protein] reductase [Exiguobacterium sp. K1]